MTRGGHTSLTKLERGEICGTLQCLVQMGVKTATELCMCVLSYDARKGLGNFVTFFVLLQWKGHYSRPTALGWCLPNTSSATEMSSRTLITAI